MSGLISDGLLIQMSTFLHPHFCSSVFFVVLSLTGTESFLDTQVLISFFMILIIA